MEGAYDIPTSTWPQKGIILRPKKYLEYTAFKTETVQDVEYNQIFTASNKAQARPFAFDAHTIIV